MVHIVTKNLQLFSVRLASIDDIPQIEWLDSFGTSPHRAINRDVEKYFGSVDPSVHERNVIFLAALDAPAESLDGNTMIGKAELLLAPLDYPSDIGYIKRVVVHPGWRGKGVARVILQYIEEHAVEYGLHYLDLHVFEGNTSALRLYETLGFQLQYRELYLRRELAPDPPSEL